MDRGGANLFDVEADIQQIAEGDVIERMAARTDFLKDLEPALQLAPVEGAEHAGVLPVMIRRFRRVARSLRAADAGEHQAEGGGDSE